MSVPELMRGSSPVRVLIIAPSSDRLGGQARQAELLVAELCHEPAVEVSFLPTNPRLPGPLRVLQSIKYLRTLSTSLLYVASLAASIRRHDVVHIFSAAHASFVISPTPALLISKLFRKAVILNYHSGEADAHLRRWRRTAARTMRLADTIVVPSLYLVRTFAQHQLNARLIRNISVPDHLQFRERRPLRPVFLSNRQLLPLYNVGCVLRAFALVQQRFGDARLIVAADGRERSCLEALSRELGLRSVEFTGWVGTDRTAELYSTADIYLNASSRDNMPNSILEAFAAGLPVVSTEAGGIPELVRNGETGILVPCDDHAELAAGAIGLLTDSELATRVAHNARAECQRFTWSAVRSEWLALYTTLATN